ncbi:MAG: NAD-dependent epimerase/dehydratase family protein [Bacteroidetes bacterium]|nr:NAD-dependent epimerase/dehydratase family protein [Bacteroidota bacterium]
MSQNNPEKKIFVTGGSGLVGSHLLLDLVMEGAQVRALRRSDDGPPRVRKVFAYYDRESLFDRIEWVDGDLLNYDNLLAAMKGAQEVYHAAAYISFNHAEFDKILEINIKGTANIVDAALENNTQHLCHVSSIATLGAPVNDEPADEETYMDVHANHSAYSISKYYAELEVWRGISEGLNAVIVNPSVILGPGNWHRSSGILFRLIRNGFKYYTLGTTGFIDVRDVSDAMIRLVRDKVSGERFVISAENMSFRRLFEMIAEGFCMKPPGRHANPFLTGVAWRAEKLRRMLMGSAPLLTRSAVQISHAKLSYSGKKYTERTGVKFRPLSLSVPEICRMFLLDNQNRPD